MSSKELYEEIRTHALGSEFVRGCYEDAVAFITNGRGSYPILKISIDDAKKLQKSMEGGFKSAFSDEEISRFRNLINDAEKASALIGIILDNENGTGHLTERLMGLNPENPEHITEYMKICLGFYHNFRKQNPTRLESILNGMAKLRKEDGRVSEADRGTVERRYWV